MNRKSFFVVLVLAFGFFAISVSLFGDNVLWYDAPAAEWTSALPLGNSRIGAMVYGNPARERVQFNEETMWGGGPHTNHSPQALANLERVRSLVFHGKNAEAQQLIDQTFLSGKHGMPFQTLGSLVIDFPGHDRYSSMRRSLCLDSALCKTVYEVEGVKYERESFTAFDDDVYVMRLSASDPGMLTFNLKFESPMKKHSVKRTGNRLILLVDGDDHEGVKGVVKGASRAKVLSRPRVKTAISFSQSRQSMVFCIPKRSSRPILS